MGESGKGFKFQPVAWLTTISVVLATATTLTTTAPLDKLVPEAVTSWLGVATVVVTAILGVLAKNRVTALAQPQKVINGKLVPLVPLVPLASPGTTPADKKPSTAAERRPRVVGDDSTSGYRPGGGY